MTRPSHFLVRTLTLLLVMASGLLVATTSAGAATAPTFVSPAPSSMVLGPLSSVTIDMGEAPAGEYNLYYGYCEGCYGSLVAEIGYEPAAGKTVTVSISDTLEADHAGFLALRGYGFDVRVDFSVTMPPWVRDLAGGPSEFYPIKDDGYKDKAIYSWESGLLNSSLVPRDVVEVLDSSGRVVLGRTSGNFSFAWDGRDSTGKTVPAGLYTVRVSSRNRLGHVASASRAVRIATGWMMEDDVIKRDANQTTGRTTTLGCNAMNRYGDLHMWCDSGRYAEVHYDFTIPRRARALRWKVVRDTSVDNPGTITIGAKRLTPTRFRIRARVTGGEYLRLSRVQIRYRTRVLR